MEPVTRKRILGGRFLGVTLYALEHLAFIEETEDVIQTIRLSPGAVAELRGAVGNARKRYEEARAMELRELGRLATPPGLWEDAA
jgi:hypothetical protein